MLAPGFGGAPEQDVSRQVSRGTADEAADRALTAISRQLDRALSVQ
jgi:hypothetical protein